MTGYLLDTNVISEWQKPIPDKKVISFLGGTKRAMIYTSMICHLELRRGALADPKPERRRRLVPWIERDLRDYFEDRLLEVSEDVLNACFDIVAHSKAKRFTPTFFDVIVAATAKAKDLMVATRNIRDFVPLAVPVLNPWTGERFNGA